jgi:DNA-nicking Smr family endonuclease
MKSGTLSHTPFKDLRFSVKKNQAENPAPTPQIPDEQSFEEAMAGVREIKEYRELAVRPGNRAARRPAARHKPDEGLELLRKVLSGETRIRISDTSEYMEWRRKGVGNDVLARLHAGEFAVQDFIDLHGLTVPEAEEALREFFREARRKGLSCVKIIHGRGLRSPKGPVLKEALKGWLSGPMKGFALAACTARDLDGGLGASYVLLKGK